LAAAEEIGEAMADDGADVPTLRVNTTMLAAGAILVVLGSVLFGGALLAAVNRWVQSLETPPQETAKQYLQQLQSVYSAGTKAWRESTSSSNSSSDEPDEILYRRIEP
jgi:hypothetical protein